MTSGKLHDSLGLDIEYFTEAIYKVRAQVLAGELTGDAFHGDIHQMILAAIDTAHLQADQGDPHMRSYPPQSDPRDATGNAGATVNDPRAVAYRNDGGAGSRTANFVSPINPHAHPHPHSVQLPNVKMGASGDRGKGASPDANDRGVASSSRAPLPDHSMYAHGGRGKTQKPHPNERGSRTDVAYGPDGRRYELDSQMSRYAPPSPHRGNPHRSSHSNGYNNAHNSSVHNHDTAVYSFDRENL